jgi:hypothetical protein
MEWRLVASPRKRCWFRARSGDRPARKQCRVVAGRLVSPGQPTSAHQHSISPLLHHSPATLASVPQPSLVFPFVPSVSQMIANSRVRRVLLRTLCAIRDHRWDWHWRGMVREFSGFWEAHDLPGLPMVFENQWVMAAARAQWKLPDPAQNLGRGTSFLDFLCYLLFYLPSTAFPQNPLQPSPRFSSVWSGGRRPPREDGALG